MSTRPVLLLDVMDTLVCNPFHVAVPAFFGMSMAELLAAKDPAAWPAFERGELSEAELAGCYFSDRRSVDLPAWRDHMKAAYAWLPGIEALLTELREQGVEMHALSNYPVWWEIIEAKLQLSRFLKWSFVSCSTGVRKPDAGAYLGAAKALGRAPEACVFVDDQPKNCAAAEALGMGAIVFEDAAQLRAALSERGLLPSWALWRQDDNGNRFEMQRSADRSELEALAAMYDARGHKQIYWVEKA